MACCCRSSSGWMNKADVQCRPTTSRPAKMARATSRATRRVANMKASGLGRPNSIPRVRTARNVRCVSSERLRTVEDLRGEVGGFGRDGLGLLDGVLADLEYLGDFVSGLGRCAWTRHTLVLSSFRHAFLA